MPENKRKLAKISDEFDKYAIGETNETYERYIFNSRGSVEGEIILQSSAGKAKKIIQTKLTNLI